MKRRGDGEPSCVCMYFPLVSKITLTDWGSERQQKRPDWLSQHDSFWAKCFPPPALSIFSLKGGTMISAKPNFWDLLGEEMRWWMWKNTGKRPTAMGHPAMGGCLSTMFLEPPVSCDLLIVEPRTRCPCHLCCLSLGDRNTCLLDSLE